MGADADQLLTVSEAAALLGVSERTIRRRMAKMSPAHVRHVSGTCPALLSMEQVEAMRPDAHSRSQEPRTDTRTVSGGSPAESGTCPAPAADIVEELRAEVAWLRDRLVAAEVARAEERRLYLAAMRALPAAPSGSTEGVDNDGTGPTGAMANEPPQTGNTGRRTWWPWRKTR